MAGLAELLLERRDLGLCGFMALTCCGAYRRARWRGDLDGALYWCREALAWEERYCRGLDGRCEGR